jgi:hypothetical protein
MDLLPHRGLPMVALAHSLTRLGIIYKLVRPVILTFTLPVQAELTLTLFVGDPSRVYLLPVQI